MTFASRAVQGGRDKMRVDDRTITITDQPGLNPNRRRWRDGPPEMALPRATPAQGAQPVFSPPTLPYARDAVPGPGPTRLTP